MQSHKGALWVVHAIVSPAKICWLVGVITNTLFYVNRKGISVTPHYSPTFDPSWWAERGAWLAGGHKRTAAAAGCLRGPAHSPRPSTSAAELQRSSSPHELHCWHYRYGTCTWVYTCTCVYINVTGDRMQFKCQTSKSHPSNFFTRMQNLIKSKLLSRWHCMYMYMCTCHMPSAYE